MSLEGLGDLGVANLSVREDFDTFVSPSGFFGACLLRFGLGSARAIASRCRAWGGYLFNRVNACRQCVCSREEEDFRQVPHGAIIAQRASGFTCADSRQD